MKKFNIFFGLLLLITSFNSHSALRVVTTTQDLAAIARTIGGQHVDVNSLTLGTRDPHFATAKPSMIRKVFRADLLLLIGADMEVAWLPPLLQSARNNRVQPNNSGYLDLSNVIPLLGKTNEVISRDMGDVHAKGNPHYWLDPRNGSRIANAIAERLALLDPQHAKEYQNNADKFEKSLQRKFVEWRATLKHLKNKPVIAYHTSFVYLAKAFGFNIVDEVEPKPGISPSASSLANLVTRIKREQISLLIIEPYYERRSSRYLQDQTSIQIAVLPQSVGAQPDIRNYIDLFDGIVKALQSTGVK
jgi:zinc/manganese transport system substrate-binding protein